MILFRKENKLATKLKDVLFTIINRLENNNNADIDSNGEAKFLKSLVGSFNSRITVFDVGANIGHYSEIIKSLCNEYGIDYSLHLFEPTRSCFGELENKFSEDKKISLNNFGVSDSESKAAIYYDCEQSGFASLYQRDLKKENVTLSMSEEIFLRKLEDYIEEKKIDKIDLLKIDIEGHELSAFKGMGKYLNAGFITAVQFEYGGANLDSKTSLRELYAVLQGAGFEIYKIMKDGLEKREYTARMENYQYSNYIALSKNFIKK